MGGFLGMCTLAAVGICLTDSDSPRRRLPWELTVRDMKNIFGHNLEKFQPPRAANPRCPKCRRMKCTMSCSKAKASVVPLAPNKVHDDSSLATITMDDFLTTLGFDKHLPNGWEKGVVS